MLLRLTSIIEKKKKERKNEHFYQIIADVDNTIGYTDPFEREVLFFLFSRRYNT